MLDLKTHFGLHNTLMTLSSLEIRNFGALRISYRYGACNGVIKLTINKIWNINQPSFLLFFCLQKNLILLSLCIHAIMMKYFCESMNLCH